jgi:hypothetical protein
MRGPRPPTDAERRAEEFYWENLRRKSGWERMRLASDLFETLKELCKSGIRAQHPDLTPEQVDAAFKRRLRR